MPLELIAKQNESLRRKMDAGIPIDNNETINTILLHNEALASFFEKSLDSIHSKLSDLYDIHLDSKDELVSLKRDVQNLKDGRIKQLEHTEQEFKKEQNDLMLRIKVLEDQKNKSDIISKVIWISLGVFGGIASTLGGWIISIYF